MTGRPPIPLTLLVRALELVDGGLSPEEASRRLKADGVVISQRRIYLAIEERKAMAAKRVKPVRAKAAKASTGPAPDETDLDIVNAEIAATRRSLSEARDDGQGARTAALQEQLRRLLDDRRELRPPPPPTADEEERRWRAAADRVLMKIAAGVKA